MSQYKTGYVYQIRVLMQDSVQIAYVPMERFVIGSLSSLPIVLRNPTVESQHLVISRVGHQIFLSDSGSRYGTRVNGKPLLSDIPHEYNPGDRIRLGHTDILLEIHLLAEVLPVHKSAEPKTVQTEAQALPGAQPFDAEQLKNELMAKTQERANQLASKIIKAAQINAAQAAERVRQELVTEAQSQADLIVMTAKNEAAAILAEAIQERDKMIAEATLEKTEVVEGSALSELTNTAITLVRSIVGPVKS